jgi:hypothetical protein
MVTKYQTESLAFLRTPKIDRHIVRMPTIDLGEDEHAAARAVVRRSTADDRYYYVAARARLRSTLAMLDPGSVPNPARA